MRYAPSVSEHICHWRCCQDSAEWWQGSRKNHRWDIAGCRCCCHTNWPCQVCNMLCNVKFVLFWEKVFRLQYQLFWLYINKTYKGERVISPPKMHLGVDMGEAAFPLFLWCCKFTKKIVEISKVPLSQRYSSSGHCCARVFWVNHICSLTFSRRYFKRNMKKDWQILFHISFKIDRKHPNVQGVNVLWPILCAVFSVFEIWLVLQIDNPFSLDLPFSGQWLRLWIVQSWSPWTGLPKSEVHKYVSEVIVPSLIPRLR